MLDVAREVDRPDADAVGAVAQALEWHAPLLGAGCREPDARGARARLAQAAGGREEPAALAVLLRDRDGHERHAAAGVACRPAQRAGARGRLGFLLADGGMGLRVVRALVQHALERAVGWSGCERRRRGVGG